MIWLAIAAVLVILVALTGARPRGGKPIERTQLMAVARVLLVIIAVICGIAGLVQQFGRQASGS